MTTKEKGPRFKSERVQISVRVDKPHWELAQRLMQKRDLHISELVERGIVYLLRAEEDEPEVTQLLRFLVGEATPDLQRRAAVCLMYLSLPNEKLNDLEQIAREGMNALLSVFTVDPRYQEQLEACRARVTKKKPNKPNPTPEGSG